MEDNHDPNASTRAIVQPGKYHRGKDHHEGKHGKTQNSQVNVSIAEEERREMPARPQQSKNERGVHGRTIFL